MPLNLSLGIALTSGGKSAFSPASLFAGGVNGGWYDPSDLTTLFQDSAGTTPVAADGQPVGKILDKSGNGNHLTQATGTKSPLYKTLGGLSWLLFDGVDDYLISSSFALTDANGQHSSGAAIQPANITGTQSVIDSDAAVRTSQNLRLNAGGSETVAFNTAAAVFVDAAGAISALADKVMTQLTQSAAAEVFVDGVGNGSTAVTGSLQNAANALKLGVSAASFTAQPYAGRIYQAVHVAKVLSGTEHPNLVTFLGSKQGRVI